jgi:hypothetical protein
MMGLSPDVDDGGDDVDDEKKKSVLNVSLSPCRPRRRCVFDLLLVNRQSGYVHEDGVTVDTTT